MSAVTVVDYCPSWPDEFATCRDQLASHLNLQAVRIDHIGSTSVPGLAAKDVLDIQIAVHRLSDGFIEFMKRSGYPYHAGLEDNAPRGADPGEWEKQVFTEPTGRRRCNIHVRRIGAANMRQALLFRVYLRAHSAVADGYGRLKRTLADQKASRRLYYEVKDPAVEKILKAAADWAASVSWHYE